MAKEIGKLKKVVNHFFRLDRHIERISEIHQLKTIEDLIKNKFEGTLFVLKGNGFYLLLGAKSKNSSSSGNQKQIDYHEGKIITGEYNLNSKRVTLNHNLLNINTFSIYEQDISMKRVYSIRLPQ